MKEENNIYNRGRNIKKKTSHTTPLIQYIQGGSFSAKEIQETIRMLITRHDAKEPIRFHYLIDLMEQVSGIKREREEKAKSVLTK